MAIKRSVATAWVLGFASLAVLLDQVTKELALTFLKENQPVQVLGEILQWRLVRNDSAAFSLGGGVTWIFTLLSSLAVLVAIFLIRKVQSKSWALMLGVALGGVAGNLIDRITREPGFPSGHVIDFIAIPFNFPIFNIADMCIFFAALFTVIRTIRGEDIGGKAE